MPLYLSSGRGSDRFCLWKKLALHLLLLALSLCQALASPATIESQKANLPTYLEKVTAEAFKHIFSAEGDRDATPKWWMGNNMGAYELVKDLAANLHWDHFLDCIDPELKFPNLDDPFLEGHPCKSCWFDFFGVKLGCVPTGIGIRYQWPIQQITQQLPGVHRYAPKLVYQEILKQKDTLYYQQAKKFHAPLMKNYAAVRGALSVDLHPTVLLQTGPIIPEFDMDSSDFPLKAVKEDYRLAGGMLGPETMLEYSIQPTILQVLWKVLREYFIFLKLLPCAPPDPVPFPFTSEMPGFVDFTRNPFLGFALYKDSGIRNDLIRWLVNPAACTEYMMAQNRSDIPFDIYDTARGLLGFFPEALKPMKNDKVGPYDRMCTSNWGSSIPFTVNHALDNDERYSAYNSMLKVLRLGPGLYETFLKGTAAAYWVRWYPFRKDRDYYQETYPERKDCSRAGSPAKSTLYPELDSREGEFGLYSFTHWARIPMDSDGWCCLDYETILDMLAIAGYDVSAVTEFIDQIQDWFNTLAIVQQIAKLIECIELVIEVIEKLEEAHAAIEDLIEMIEELYDAIATLVGEVFEQIDDWLGIFDRILTLFDDVMTTIDSFEHVLDAIYNHYFGKIEDYLEFLNNCIEDVEYTFTDPETGETSTVSNKTCVDIFDLFTAYQKLFDLKDTVIQRVMSEIEAGTIDMTFDELESLVDWEAFLAKVMDELIDDTMEWIEQKYDDADINWKKPSEWGVPFSFAELRRFVVQQAVYKLQEHLVKIGAQLDLHIEDVNRIIEIVEEEVDPILAAVENGVAQFIESVKNLKQLYDDLKETELPSFDPQEMAEEFLSIEEVKDWKEALEGHLESFANLLSEIEEEMDETEDIIEAISTLATSVENIDELVETFQDGIDAILTVLDEIPGMVNEAIDCFEEAMEDEGDDDDDGGPF